MHTTLKTVMSLSIFVSIPVLATILLLSRYVTLSNIQSNASQGLLGNTTFISAGAALPSAAESTDANQCSFASVYRNAKRGGPYIAQPADLPTSSIYVSPGSDSMQALFSCQKRGCKVA